MPLVVSDLGGPVPQDVQSLIGKKLKAEEETSDENVCCV
jgi:hypothetical protein